MLKNTFLISFSVLCTVLPALGQSTTIAENSAFATTTNANWPYVITLATLSDDSAGNPQQMAIAVTGLPEVTEYRIVRTLANGNYYNGAPQQLAFGATTITVPAAAFDRVVKVQFSRGDLGFSQLYVNGEQLFPEAENPGDGTTPVTLSNSFEFSDGPNTTWPESITLTTIADGASSQGEQTLNIFVNSTAGGATYRIVRTNAGGNFFNGSAIALSTGSNDITVPGVDFDRTVKLQFSNSDLTFNSLSINGTQNYPGAIPRITLTGNSNIQVDYGSAYTDAGATAVDEQGNDVTVSTTGSVNTNVVGTYTITYDATDSAGNSAEQLTRTVEVLVDSLPPVITLNGDSTVTVTQGDVYTDPGATATDAVDGDVDAYLASGSVDTSVVGVYTLTYEAYDDAGNYAEVLTRTVTVVEADSDGDGVVDSLDVHAGFDDAALTTYLSDNGYAQGGLTQQDLLDARVGSAAVSVSGGTATISLQVEQSADGMQTWSSPAEGATTVDIPVTGDASFFRVRAQ